MKNLLQSMFISEIVEAEKKLKEKESSDSTLGGCLKGVFPKLSFTSAF